MADKKKKRIIFSDWEQIWQSNKYKAKIKAKTFYILRFHIIRKMRPKNGKHQIWLMLWIKDLYAPGKACHYLQLPMYDYTKGLQKSLAEKKGWVSKQYKANRKFITTILVQAYLTFRKSEKGAQRPALKMQLRDILEPGQPAYIARLSIADFKPIMPLLERYDYKSYRPR